MKHKIYIGLLSVMFIALLLCGCAHTGLVAGPGPTEPAVDRKEFITGVIIDYDDKQLVKDDVIDAFVAVYNINQEDTAALVSESYQTYYDIEKGVYYVDSHDNGVNLTIRKDNEGQVIVATPSAIKDTTMQLTVSTAIMDVLWGRDYVPEENALYMQALLDKAKALSAQITDKTNDFANKIKTLDTSLPRVEEPQVDQEFLICQAAVQKTIDAMFDEIWNAPPVTAEP